MQTSAFYPSNEPAIGSVYQETDVYPQNKNVPLLFQPLTIKEVTFKNRIFVSPMCQYSSDNGHATDWHLVHLGQYAIHGVGAICIEATAVVPEGRISPDDAGLWTDSQIAPLQRIVNFAHAHGTKIGIQLAHAGRKASMMSSWRPKPHAIHVADENHGGWPTNVYGPSEIPYDPELFPKPKAMTEEDMQYVEDAFVAAVERCEKIGFDFIEIHGAHGYLMSSFVSPLSNTRTDAYGQSLSNRLRFPLRVISRVRAAWPSKPLFVRISASDWAEGPEKGEDGTWKQWGIEQSKVYAGEMENIGVDLVDCSSGGNWVKQNIPISPGYQVPFAEAIKKTHPSTLVGAVGLITNAKEAEEYLQAGKADVVLLARELMRNPSWALSAALELGVAVKPANQYEFAWPRMLSPMHLKRRPTEDKQEGAAK